MTRLQGFAAQIPAQRLEFANLEPIRFRRSADPRSYDMEVKNSLLKNQIQDLYLTRTAQANDPARAGEEKSGTRAAGVSAEGDRVSLSQSARLHTLAYAEAGKAPDVRKDKVEELKARIASGDYTTDDRKIAEKLVQNEAFLAKTLSG